eukprot:CAMPEP_0198223304 /NCGR_PEP_ID=MMETSP1445-20131203/91960_1 /TAXON_ID=36898 /ORGANISM="Pyramimonas sp., Strain CCMP2087" /LENGTH=36 /DNA_ID= /DNA_START= /DNA_END= /DNA_ORIENTATION=
MALKRDVRAENLRADLAVVVGTEGGVPLQHLKDEHP